MPQVRQRKAIAKVLESEGKISVSQAMREAGYPESTARNPQRLTRSKAWEKLVEGHLSDKKLAERHAQLLDAAKLDHMVFPLGPKKTKEKSEYIAMTETKGEVTSDEEIGLLLKDVGCTMRKVVHGETARHVYFWAPDNKARKEALDMAYELKRKYPAPAKAINAFQFNIGKDRDDYA